MTGPDPGRTDRVRVAFLVVLGAVVCVSILALVALAVTGTASPLGAVVGAVGAAAVGALAAQLSR